MTEQQLPELDGDAADLETVLRSTYEDCIYREPPGYEAAHIMNLLGAALKGTNFTHATESRIGHRVDVSFGRDDRTTIQISFDADPETYSAPRDAVRIEEKTANALAAVTRHLQLFGGEAIDPEETAIIAEHFRARELYAQHRGRVHEHVHHHDAVNEFRAIFGDFDFGKELEAIKFSRAATYGHPESYQHGIAEAAVTLARAGNMMEAELLLGTIPEGGRGRESTALVYALAELGRAGNQEALSRAVALYANLIDYQAADVGAEMTMATGDSKYAEYSHKYAMERRIDATDSTRDIHRYQRAVLLGSLSRIAGNEHLLEEAREMADTIHDTADRITAFAALGRYGDRDSLNRAIQDSREETLSPYDGTRVYGIIALATAEVLRPRNRTAQKD